MSLHFIVAFRLLREGIEIILIPAFLISSGNTPSDAPAADQLFSMLDAAAAHINPRSLSVKIRAGSKTCEQFSQLFGEVQYSVCVCVCIKR